MAVTLTPADRQILINQYAILEKLDPDNAEDYKRNQKILNNGFAILYNDVVNVWDEMDAEDGKYVMDVLDMHRDLKYSFDDLDDKAGLTAEDVEYEGFDGNNETMRLALAEELKAEGRWQELDLTKNSHSTTTKDRYPKMLARYREVSDKKAGKLLTADEIKYVIEWKKQ